MHDNHSTHLNWRPYGSYLAAQLQEQKQRHFHPRRPGPAVTLTGETGSGEHEIANRLAAILQKTESQNSVPWTVFDRQLVEQVLREHQFPAAMAQYIPEDHRSFIEEEIGEILGLHPPAWIVVPHVTETVLRLADAGQVILVGRGAAFITMRLPNVFHVRLVAPLAHRIERVQRIENLTAKEAAKFIARSDRGRHRYARAYFRARPNDDLLYHLVINTARIPCPAAAELIAEQARIAWTRDEAASPLQEIAGGRL